MIDWRDITRNKYLSPTNHCPPCPTHSLIPSQGQPQPARDKKQATNRGDGSDPGYRERDEIPASQQIQGAGEEDNTRYKQPSCLPDPGILRKLTEQQTHCHQGQHMIKMVLDALFKNSDLILRKMWFQTMCAKSADHYGQGAEQGTDSKK